MSGRSPAPRGGFVNVFVLCTGRCGSLTFSQACRAAVSNYSAGHESNLSRCGPDRLSYPARHIEVDNRLAWFLGRLDERYGTSAFYVHLMRDAEATARSYARRRALGFLLHAWMRGIHVGLDDVPDHLRLARDLVDTVNANIRCFLRSQPHHMAFALESAAAQFPSFFDRIGAEGDMDAGLEAWRLRYNASVVPAAEADAGEHLAAVDRQAAMDADIDQPLDWPRAQTPAALSSAVPVSFPSNAPLPAAVRALMECTLPARNRTEQGAAPVGTALASVTGRDPDLSRHLARMAQDFAGDPALCMHVGTLVVKIRRGVDLGPSLEQFFSLIHHPESGSLLARRLSLRWLVSVLDTCADHAGAQEAAEALALSTLVNTLKLAETERLIEVDPSHDPARRQRLAERFPVPLFGGLNAFRLESGDMVANLFARLEKQLMDRAFAYAAFDRLRRELRDQPQLFQRLAAYHPRLF